jgi:hypothetical protein
MVICEHLVHLQALIVPDISIGWLERKQSLWLQIAGKKNGPINGPFDLISEP